MTALLKIDQAGLPAGVAGRSRTDGLATGALVTLTNTGSGTTLMRLLWAPPGDTTALSSLAVTGDPKVWTFSPTAGRYGSYLVELIADQGLVTEKRERRVLAVRTPNRGLVIPALNERGDNAASLLAAGQEQVEASNNNAVDYLDATLNGVPYAGWWRAIHEMMMALDTGIAGSNLVGVGQVLGQPIGGTAGPAFPLTGAQLGAIVNSVPWREVEENGAGPFANYDPGAATNVHILASNAAGAFNGVINSKAGDLLLISHQGAGYTDVVHNSTSSFQNRFFIDEIGNSLRIFDNQAVLFASIAGIEGGIGSASARKWFPISFSSPFGNTVGNAAGDVIAHNGTKFARVAGGNSADVVLRGNATFGRVSNAALANTMLAGTVKLRALDTGTGVPIDGTAAQLDAIMRTVAGVQRVVSVDTTVQTWSGDNIGRTVGGTVVVPASPAGTAYRIRAHLTIVVSAVAAPAVEFGLRYGNPAGAFEEQLVTLSSPTSAGTYHAIVEGHLQLLGTARMFVRVETTMAPSAPLQFGAKGVAIVAGSLWMRARLGAGGTLSNTTITVENAYVERLY